MFDDLIPKAQATGGISFDDLVPAVDRAKAELARGLREGRNGDLETYRAAAFKTNQGVPTAGATDAAIQGATLGFGDEISAAARAPIDMALRGEGFNEAYQHNLAAERDRYATYKNANPITATAAEIAGGMRVPVGNAGPVRTGATIGAIAGAGSSEGDLAQRAGDAAVGGAGGAVLGAALSGASRLVGGKAPSSAPSIDELKAAARAGYNSAEVAGLEIKPQSFANLATGTKVRLNESGLDENLAPKTFAILSNVERIPEGAIATGKNLETLRKTLGKAAGSTDPQERAAASKALEELTRYAESVPSADVLRGDAAAAARTIKEANANYSAAKHAENIDNKTIQAELRAAAANSGQNVANTVRQRMADILIKPKERRGFTEEELGLMEKIVRGTVGQNVLRGAGNLLGGGGGLGAITSAAVGGYATGGPGAIAPVVGFGLKALSNKMTLAQAEKLSEAIRSRAPLASASQKFEEKAAEFVSKRTAKTASGAALAARNFASNLRSAGFNVSASDLFGGLQATGRADNEPDVPRRPNQ